MKSGYEADPEIVEEWKWMGMPVRSRGEIICTGETYKKVVKLTFATERRWTTLRIYYSSLDGNVRRAIDIREDETIDAKALKDLVRAAAALNLKGKGSRAISKKTVKRISGRSFRELFPRWSPV